MLEIHRPCSATEVLLLHAPYPGILKFEGMPSSALSAIAPFAHELARRGELERLSLLDPPAADEAYREELRAALSLPALRVLCISTSTAAIEEAAWAVALARELCGEELLVIVGGPHEDDCEQKTAERIQGVDLSMGGECEFVLAEVLHRFLEQQQAPAAFLGVVPSSAWASAELQGGAITLASPHWSTPVHRLELPRIHPSSLPEPIWTEKRPHFSVLDAPETLPVMVSRGCPYGRCTFCAEANRDGVALRQSFEWIAELAEARPEAGIYFQDSIFPSGDRVARELLPMLNRLGRPWGCQVFLPMLSRDFVAQLADAGCSYLYTGIESASSEVLAGIGKGKLRSELVLERLGWFAEHGIEAGLSLMFGAISTDGRLLETTETVDRTLELTQQIIEAGVRVAGFYPNITTVLPGTPLARGLAASGFDLDFYRMPRAEAFSEFEDGAVGYNFVTLGLDDAKTVASRIASLSRNCQGWAFK